MSMSFIAGAAAAVAVGGLILGGIAASPGDGGFEEIRPWEVQSRNVGPRHGFVPARRVTSDGETVFGRESYGERFRYAD
jgi:hypothetical protein